jgi:hypothetical protein
VTDQVSHPYKTTGKIIVLYILFLYFWTDWSRQEIQQMIQKLASVPFGCLYCKSI